MIPAARAVIVAPPDPMRFHSAGVAQGHSMERWRDEEESGNLNIKGMIRYADSPSKKRAPTPARKLAPSDGSSRA
jgi:hypothetical protein